jgi:hypothetical protein
MELLKISNTQFETEELNAILLNLINARLGNGRLRVCNGGAFLQNLQVQRERLSAMHHYGRKKSQILGGIIHGSSGKRGRTCV